MRCACEEGRPLRRIVVSVLAFLLPASCSKVAPAPTAESRAVGEALAQLCAPVLAHGAPKKIEAYAPRMQGLGWGLDNPPGVYLFDRQGAWGRVRVAFSSDFRGPCTIRAWAPQGAAAHDGAATASAVDTWARAAAPDAERETDRVAVDQPPGALRSEWRGGGWSIVVKELPVAGGRPVVQVDVRRGVE